ncbi:1,4-alpha-glucan branching enzyme [Sphingobacterium nematocida]|uniref:1,4-alpha-glucan branching enzyme n=2 Tax=Sphingobacterium nematocida TaxID=1513896 RepID=A0A1T5GR64_9SPHI|nr:1,4-alpha-glucan branching enzyme [Sphingobacterium nematocida]
MGTFPVFNYMRSYLFILFVPILLVIGSCKKGAPNNDPNVVEDNLEGLMIVEQGFLSWDKEVTLIFDPSKGNAELKNVAGDFYLHMGLITTASSTPQDWKNVISSWTDNSNTFKLKKRADGKYSYTFTPAALYKLSDAKSVHFITLLVRNADGTKVARNKDGADLYLPIVQQNGLALRFNYPETQPTYALQTAKEAYAVGEEISFEVLGSQLGKISLSLDGEQVGVAENAKSLKATYKVNKVGHLKFVAQLEANGEKKILELRLFVAGKTVIADLPQGAKPNGVTLHKESNTVTFALTAPQKESVFLLGDFNQYTASEKYALKRSTDGKTFWISVPDLNWNQKYTYQFLVDGDLTIADPYSELVLDPVHDAGIKAGYLASLPVYPAQAKGIVSVLNLNAAPYLWVNSSFKKPNPYDLVIYETLLRDFVNSHDYTTLKDSIRYFEKLGVNVIQLMPVQESEGNSTWGYNPSFHLALDKYYGSQAELKSFIDASHQKGIAVILDVVLNHAFGQSPMVQMYFKNGATTATNPWFNPIATHPYNVGYDFNHESALTQTFVKDVLKYWMSEYKIDGFRFDLSKGFTQKNSGTAESAVGAWTAYDASRVQLWKMYNSYIRSVDPDAYVILEHFADDREEKELAEEGMFLWNNLNHVGSEAAMGYNDNGKSDLSRLFFQKRAFTSPNLISYIESHDEERLMYKNIQYGNAAGSYSIKNLNTAIDRNIMLASFFMLSPGPKMIWQFGELGYDVSINQNGRTGEKPINWAYYNDPVRTKLFKHYANMIRIKKSNPIFRNGNLVESSLNSHVKYFVMEQGGQKVLLLGNFDVVSRAVAASAFMSGTWYDNGSHSTKVYNPNQEISLAPGEFYVLSNTKLNN